MQRCDNMENAGAIQNESLNPPNLLVFLTNRVGRLLANNIRKRAAQDGMEIIPTQMGILVDLWVKDGLRQQDLAVSLIKDKATVARALDHFEKQNIVVRVPDMTDKRYKRIFLTHKGKEMRDQIYPMAIQTEQQALEGITEQDLAVCKKVLQKLYENLKR